MHYERVQPVQFVDTKSHLTTKLHNFYIKCHSNSESYDQHGFVGSKFRGGQNFLFTMGGFPNERECSGADWLDSLLTTLNIASFLMVFLRKFRKRALLQWEQSFRILDLKDQPLLYYTREILFLFNITISN